MIWRAESADQMVQKPWPLGCNVEAKSAKDPSKEAAKETEKSEKPAATKPALQAAWYRMGIGVGLTELIFFFKVHLKSCCFVMHLIGNVPLMIGCVLHCYRFTSLSQESFG